MKKQKNIIRSADEYTRYYGDFRGVDFSSDHTQVNDHRFAYAINMYKDYRNGEGNAIETIPGFRRRFEAPRILKNDGTFEFLPINGIHEFSFIDAQKKRDKDILIHAGKNLYLWDEYPLSANVILQFSVNVIKGETGDADNDGYDDYKYLLDFPVAEIVNVSIAGTKFTEGYKLTVDNGKNYLQFTNEFVNANVKKTALINYKESIISTPIYADMKDAQSKSFVFNQKLYIIDGKGFYQYSSNNLTPVINVAYVPVVYSGIGLGENAPTDMRTVENEQINLLSQTYIHSYIADGNERTYPLYSNDSITEVKVYGEAVTSYTVNAIAQTITFENAPSAPKDASKPEGYAGVEIVYSRAAEDYETDKEKILKCTIAAIFDKRVFLTGNPDYPNNIWYCGINNTTGYEDCTYFGELNVVVDGVENAPITGLIPVADTLAALKNHARQDGTIYFHNRLETNRNVLPVTYPASQGLSGYGCLGACVNFLDDPIFISSLGVEGIGQLSVRLERAVEHRSSLIDAKLVNLNLENAQISEWDGYLVILVDGHIFLGDARQKYAGNLGQAEYEWYYLENIGIYENQVNEYYYAPTFYVEDSETEDSETEDSEMKDVIVTKDGVDYEIALADQLYNSEFMTSENKINTPVDVKTQDSIFTDERFADVFFILQDTWDGVSYENNNRKIIRKAIVCEDRGSFTGGTFYPAKNIVNIDENLFFGTNNGIVCSFNFDQRLEDGTVLPTSYAFDNRTIYCGIATKMDNCGIPHLNKSTIKKSTVIKTKSLLSAVTKVRVRTNKSGYKSIARINSRIFSFADTDFSDFTFISTDQTIFSIKEKEKNWVEKQHWLYSDEYQKPFSVYYIAFRYKISGRIKEIL